jgi:dipeptidyl aminopeptidase/acylaminoacyl peptidase
MATAERRNIEFGVEGGVTLRGWLFVPNAKGPAPAITMAHGYAGVKEHGIERFVRAIAEAGFVVLVHDQDREFLATAFPGRDSGSLVGCRTTGRRRARAGGAQACRGQCGAD